MSAACIVGSLLLAARAPVEQPPAAEQWHTFEVRLVGGELQVRLDGRSVLVHRDQQPLPPGPIGLQHNQGWVEFRNFSVRAIGDAGGQRGEHE